MNSQYVLWLANKRPKAGMLECFSRESLSLIYAKHDQLDDVSKTPDIIFIDFVNSAEHVETWVTAVRAKFPSTPMIVIVESGQSALASKALACGAIDYLLYPFTESQLFTSIRDAHFMRQNIGDMVAVSQVSQQVLRLANRAAQTNGTTICIQGESGTGKEKLAQFIHQTSPRSDKPFVAVNCAAIPENMLEAMLFGHAKGAFTGAVNAVAGKFELANGGTLLLDEISELPLGLQSKLLRVLQEREVERVGSHQKIRLNLRIIACCNKDLRELVAQGLFREDLFYRLDVLPLRWPALRERMEDVLPLAQHFIKKYGQDKYLLSSGARDTLLAYNWPGNVRELENVMQRALVMARGMELQAEDLGLPIAVVPQPDAGRTRLRHTKKQAEFDYIYDLLQRFNGHRSRTAEALGMSTRALRYKLAAMREVGIDIDAIAS
ncbi:ATPase AAA [Shewanella mangrovi]|uniref:ATPase AAA n=1 Tax=Shewanella mangrovi TaxID=1515746 RepID=A0A094JJE6_9GAMM|nr:sigma-54 dependent transcriptional regulator [Shewanella mangrovi]KFZ38174.1 ATPase AAA [Shewanella mangrovi]